MNCPYCNEEHTNKMKFCPNTGQKLYIKENKCSKCGNTNVSQYDVFCTNCGNKLKDIESTNPTTKPISNIKPAEKKTMYVGGNIITHIFAILFCLVGIIGGVALVIMGEFRIGIPSIVISSGMGWVFFIFPNK